jgi:N-terminal domain of galactosyltransferase/N-terminal region of glycosyl transferase group 7
MNERKNFSMTPAFIVPFRNRFEHLKAFVPHIKKRFPSSPIFIIEQADQQPFNRAKLLNIGFLHFNSMFDYFAAHDIDMLPVKSDYSFPDRPTHLATQVQQFGYRMPYPEYFGGVTLFNKTDFEKLNGYSNEFWGWGGEDDEIYKRCQQLEISIDRRKCIFRSLRHDHKIDFKLHRKNIEHLQNGRSNNDGLNCCLYHVESQTIMENYIHLKVSL